MDEGLYLSIRASADAADVGNAELAPHNNTPGAQLAREGSAIG